MSALPALVGVIHLSPLPDSPRYGWDLDEVIEGAVRDARALTEAGFDGLLVENFGDAPFYPAQVPPVTVAAMTACASAVRAIFSGALGINVLRNDAAAALAVALVARADFVRINVHTGARVTDQGLVEGLAHRTLRRRRELGAGHVKLFCDVDVKHSEALAARSIAEEAADVTDRGLADAILITGRGTGLGADAADLDRVRQASKLPVYIASGVTEKSLEGFAKATGVIVGSAVREGGRAGQPVDPERARRFAGRFRACFPASKP